MEIAYCKLIAYQVDFMAAGGKCPHSGEHQKIIQYHQNEYIPIQKLNRILS